MEVGGNEEACQKGAGGAGKQVAGFQEGREKERESVERRLGFRRSFQQEHGRWLAMVLLERILEAGLCPKAYLENISEYAPVEELFKYGKRSGWSTKEFADTWIVARGIRGREGVTVLLEFSQREYPRWHSGSYVEAFVGFFAQKWREEVQKTGSVSALSHQEGLHAGMSGMNFVQTLNDKENLEALFSNQGVASRLAKFFERPEDVDAAMLMRFYKELVKQPIRMTPKDYIVQIEGARLVGKRSKKEENDTKRGKSVTDGSYSSMDFLRSWANIMTSVFESPEVLFTSALWAKMIACQAKPAETKDLIEYFGLDMDSANKLISQTRGLNWTTLLVCLCEVRQAAPTVTALEDLQSLACWVGAYPERLVAVQKVVDAVVQEGARSKQCYCERVCDVVQEWKRVDEEQLLGRAAKAVRIRKGVKVGCRRGS